MKDWKAYIAIFIGISIVLAGVSCQEYKIGTSEKKSGKTTTETSSPSVPRSYLTQESTADGTLSNKIESSQGIFSTMTISANGMEAQINADLSHQDSQKLDQPLPPTKPLKQVALPKITKGDLTQKPTDAPVEKPSKQSSDTMEMLH